MDIWDVESRQYRLEDLLDDDIQLAEDYFGVKLPDDYIKLLKKQNGGTLIYNALPIAFNRWDGDDFLEIDNLRGIKKDKGIMQTDYFKQEWGISKSNIILISGDGHTWIALDYNHGDNPKVIYIESDEDKITPIYNSFKEMLDHLYIHEHEEEEDLITTPPPTVEDARKLINSKDMDDIINGIETFNSLIDDKSIHEEYFGYLLNFIKSGNENLKDRAAEAVWRVVTAQFVLDKSLIQKVIDELKNDNDPSIQMILEEIEETVKNIN
ncbi:SMI1/KNR4 family protein [Niallia sp. FSL R7-0271]|uniref:SMI1/KNR4 family protein n=1 Tax=Niallia sp. FSL R7-0271 TaxID=2921678 RepID=UPI0030FC0704